ncbi:hypothetical protein prwr041_24910 [Prevotella herbatica]|uniref:DUF1837 domain-containing protein n=1 Tax=Prevotella herbatica TaxID=2801997 RepID=A0ABN6ENM8_9BACT|nr:hypothetical protein [Prevotella herbatica]BCS86598.1 hypothetical protein prwr041_24910 [Prevotella herbatica]
MKVTKIDRLNYLKPEQYPNCDIFCLHVLIDDLEMIIAEMRVVIAGTSWINRLRSIDQKIYTVNSKKTIDKIVNIITSRVVNELNDSVGEYMISYTAQKMLVDSFNHFRLPLAELLKEKISGNPGFDFHTISEKKLLNFGEAKFSMKETPKDLAINQISDFIKDEKDYGELLSLKPLVDSLVIDNMDDGKRGYIAAFSFNSKSIDTIFKHALNSDAMKNIGKYQEFYLIAIQVC